VSPLYGLVYGDMPLDRIGSLTSLSWTGVYNFASVCPKQWYIISRQSVLNRVISSCESVLNRQGVISCGKKRQWLLGEFALTQLAINGFKTRRMPNRVILIERVVLNKIRKLGYFCPKQHQGVKLSAVHLYPNISRVPPPPPPTPPPDPGESS